MLKSLVNYISEVLTMCGFSPKGEFNPGIFANDAAGKKTTDTPAEVEAKVESTKAAESSVSGDNTGVSKPTIRGLHI